MSAPAISRFGADSGVGAGAAPALLPADLLLLVLVLGGIGFLGWAIFQQLRLNRLVSSADPASERDLLASYYAICRELGLRRRPRLLLSPDEHVPVAFGVLHPTVMLPRELVRRLPLAEIRTILAHELAHYSRGDLWVNLLQLLLSAVWWFNPVYWLPARGIRAVREDCCDDLVVAAGLSPRAAYCQTLLNAAQIAAGRVMAGASFACPRESHRLRRRLGRIMNKNWISQVRT